MVQLRNQLSKILLCFILSYTLFCCGDSLDIICSTAEDSRNVSGIQFNDFNGQSIGTYQLPNDCSITNPFVSVFPNPAIDQIFISNGAEAIEFVWLVRANCPSVCEGYVPTAEQINNTILEADELASAASIDFSTVDLTNPDFFAVDVSSIEDGVYKIFLQLNNGDIIWQNLLITDSVAIEDAIEFLDNNCR